MLKAALAPIREEISALRGRLDKTIIDISDDDADDEEEEERTSDDDFLVLEQQDDTEEEVVLSYGLCSKTPGAIQGSICGGRGRGRWSVI
jgi:hypothetical protein